MNAASVPQPSVSVVAVLRPGDTHEELLLFLEHIRSLEIPALQAICLYDATGRGESLDLPDDLPFEVRRGFWDEDLGRARNDALEMSVADWSLVLGVHERLTGDVGGVLKACDNAQLTPADVGIVNVITPEGRFRFGRLIRRGSTVYIGAEAEIVAVALRAGRRSFQVSGDDLTIESARGLDDSGTSRQPRHLRRLIADVARAEAEGGEQLPALLFELAAEYQALGNVPAALDGYRRLDEDPDETTWTWAAREATADLLLSQGRLDEAGRVVAQLQEGPNPAAAWWLRTNLHLARGEYQAAFEELRTQQTPAPLVGPSVPEEAVLRTRFEVASRAGVTHESLVALLTLMAAGHDIEGHGAMLLRLWGRRSPEALAEVIADTGTPHLEEIAAELASVSGKGRHVARELRARRRRYSVAAVVIARDEARCIQRCVESVLPWVDEVLVADTGSQDETATLAEAAGARVVHVPWTDDFSAARNAALEAAHADWHVILDADEVIAAGGTELRDLAQVPPDVVIAVNVVSSFRLAEGLETEAEAQSRILPGTVRYRGIVHARPEHDLPVSHVRVTIEHDGYEPEQLADKLPRRERLLQRAVEAEPDNAYLRYQLARNLETQRRMEEAAAEYDRIDVDALSPEPWHHILVVQKAHTLTAVGRTQEALDFLLGQTARFDASPDFHFVLGNVLVDVAAARPDMAGEALPLAVTEFRRCLAIGERDDLPGHVSGRGSRLAERNLRVVLAGCQELGLPVPSEDGPGAHDGQSSPEPASVLPNGSLDVVMIVKNEEDRLGNALESCAALRPLLGEVCVYDTGSTDSTRDIARSHGARVVEGYWDDNYSRARNAAAAMSEAPWLLVLDADEVIEADAEAMAREIAAAEEAGEIALYVQVQPDEAAVGAGKQWMSPRIYRPDLAHYARPVHAELRRRDGEPLSKGEEWHLSLTAIRIDNYGVDQARLRISNARSLHLVEEALRVARTDSERVAALVDRARARRGAGDLDGARADLERATSLEAATSYGQWARQMLTDLLLEMGSPADAREAWSYLKGEYPYDPFTRWLEGRLLAAEGSYREAFRRLHGLVEVHDAVGFPVPPRAVAREAFRAASASQEAKAVAAAARALATISPDDADLQRKAIRLEELASRLD